MNLAYHLRFMKESGEDYKALLAADFENLKSKQFNMTMSSAVLGCKMEVLADAHYWKKNMVCSVMFDQVVQAIITEKDGVNFPIELGLSNALAGHVKKIVTKLGSQVANVQYCTALSRGTIHFSQHTILLDDYSPRRGRSC